MALQRSYRRTFNDHRNLFTLFCRRNNARWTPVLPCTRQAHWSTCGQIEFVRYCSYCEQNGIPRWGMSRWSWWLSLQRMFPCLWCSLSYDSFTIMQKYPGFADRIHEGLVDIFGEKGRFVLVSSLSFNHLSDWYLFWILKRNIITHHAEDGSGVGSAIIAGSCFWFIILWIYLNLS